MADTKIKTCCCLLMMLCLLTASDAQSSTDDSTADVSSSTDVSALDMELLSVTCTPVTMAGSSLSPQESAEASSSCYTTPSMSLEGNASESVGHVTPSVMEPSARTESPTSGDVMSSMTMIIPHIPLADMSDTTTVMPNASWDTTHSSLVTPQLESLTQEMMTFQPSVSSTSHDVTALNERSSLFPEDTSSTETVTPSPLGTASTSPSPPDPPQTSETPSSSVMHSSPDTSTETAVTSSVEAVSTSAGVAVTTSTTGTVSESVATEPSPTTLPQNSQTSSASDAQSSTDTLSATSTTSSTQDVTTSVSVAATTTPPTPETPPASSSTTLTKSSVASSSSVSQSTTDTSPTSTVTSPQSNTDTSPTTTVTSSQSTTDTSVSTTVTSSQSTTDTSPTTTVTSSQSTTDTSPTTTVTSSQSTTDTSPTTTVTSSQSTMDASPTTTVTSSQSTTDTSVSTTVTSSQSTTDTSPTTTVTSSQSTTDASPTTTVTSSQSTTDTSPTTTVTSSQSTTDTSVSTTVTSSQSTTDTSLTTTVTSSQSTTDTSPTTTVTSSQSTTDTSPTTTVTSPQSTTDTSVITTLTSSSISTAGAETTTSTTVAVSSNGTVSTLETKSTTATSSSSNDTSTQPPVQTSSSDKATVSSVPPSTAISSTSSSDVTVNSSLVEDCYRGLPSSQLTALYRLMHNVTCSRQHVVKVGDVLRSLTLPVLTIPDVKAIMARNATWASNSLLPDFNSSVNCSAFDFDNLTDAAILSVLVADLVTGMPALKLSLDDALVNATSCVTSLVAKAAADVYANELDEISRAYRNITSLLKVYADGVLAALQRVTGCSGVADCNGVCGGKARLDWECRVCYGGDTVYKITFAGDLKDCTKTCLGKAFVEPCTGTCVGGNTGRRAEDYVDCAGICLGPNIRDSCNICVANTTQSRHGSQFMDCTGKCFVKANMSSMAVNNSCGVCVLGDTGRPANSGVDVCGVCNGTNSTCQDCEHVPNGGKVPDACGVCGGQGTLCLAVTSVSPGVVPSGVQKVVVVAGAGFNASLDTCVAEGRDTGGNQTVFSRSSTPPDVSRLTVTLPSTLAADSYTIKCRLTGGSYANSTAVVIVYNSSVATVSGVSKTNFTISPSSQEVIEFQGSGFMSNSTFCKLTDTSGGVKYVVATVLNGSSATCSVSHPEVSERYTVQVTFNQVDPVGPSFTLTAWAPAPSVLANISDNGDKVQVFFSPAVDLQQGSACGDILSSVVSLGAGAVCSVVSRQLLHITDSAVQPGSVLVLKDDTIRTYGQRFARTAAGNVTVTSPSNPVTPRAVLTGPDVVSSCTKSFSVDGRRSTGLGGRPGNYSWLVDPSFGLSLDGSTSSVLTVSNMSAGQQYNVTLTLCNFLGQCHTASHTVSQTASNAPDVVIETFADVTKVKPSDRLTLVAKATLYPNCADDQVVFRWSFNTTFQLNADYITRPVYTIDPYLLPVPATIVASVSASLATNDSIFNTASVRITTVLSNLDARIQGADVRAIGVDSGDFTLDATQSLDPDGLAGDMTYIWTCVELGDYPTSCLDKNSQVMPSSSQKTQGSMTLSAGDLEAGRRYLFTVTVSKKSQGASRFASTNVTVIALAGDPPRVQLNLFNGNRGRYSADEMVTLAAELTASSPVTVQWTSYESSDYGYVNLSDSAVVGAKQEPLLVDSATNAYVAFLTIRAGVLSRGTTYRVQCQVTAANQSATSAVSFYVRRGVTSCKFSIEGGSYTELGALRGKVEQCDTDQDGHPMTFDFFVLTEADTASVKRLTKPSSLGQLDIPYGPRAYLSGGNSFIVQVCAALGGCTWFNSSFVTVTPINSGSLTTIKTTIIKAAKDLRKSGNPLDGILSLATYLQSQLSSRSRRSAGIQTPDVNGLVLDFANDTLRTMYPSETVLKTLMDGLASVPPTSLSDDDLLRMLSIYEEIATGYGAADVSAMSPEQVGQIKRFENYLVSTRGLPSSQNLSLILTAAWRKSLAFGSKAEVDTDKGTLSYSVQALSSTELSRSSSSPVSLSFGDTLNKRYNRWSCGSSQCLGVGVEVFHYSTNTYPNPPPDTTLSADVVTLTLFDQNSGADISNISNLESPATLTFPLVQPKGAPYLCKYWEATSRTWRTEGVTTSLQTADTVVCTTTHLTDFTVVSDSSSGSSNAALIGGVVGGVLGALFLIVIVVIVVFYFKKQNRVGSTPSLRRVLVTSKGEESASTQNLQVREQPDIGQQTHA